MNMQDTIFFKIMEAGAEISKHKHPPTVPEFLGNFMIMLATQFYESAPNCESAEWLMNEAIRIAKERFLKEQQDNE